MLMRGDRPSGPSPPSSTSGGEPLGGGGMREPANPVETSPLRSNTKIRPSNKRCFPSGTEIGLAALFTCSAVHCLVVPTNKHSHAEKEVNPINAPSLNRPILCAGSKIVKWRVRLPFMTNSKAEPSELIATSVRCASLNKRFWKLHHALMTEKRLLWGSFPYERVASIALMKVEDLKTCLADPKIGDEIARDITDASDNHFNGTPTFVVGRLVKGRIEGEVVTGAIEWKDFEAVVQKYEH